MYAASLETWSFQQWQACWSWPEDHKTCLEWFRWVGLYSPAHFAKKEYYFKLHVLKVLITIGFFLGLRLASPLLWCKSTKTKYNKFNQIKIISEIQFYSWIVFSSKRHHHFSRAHSFFFNGFICVKRFFNLEKRTTLDLLKSDLESQSSPSPPYHWKTLLPLQLSLQLIYAVQIFFSFVLIRRQIVN